MVDIFSSSKRSEIMSKIRSKETNLEIKFRKEIWRLGYRYRKNSKKYFGTPDLVLAKMKTVIFIDSCFWHGCRLHATVPKTNRIFWKKKILRNMARDREVDRYYKKNKWQIFRFWEHDLKNNL